MTKPWHDITFISLSLQKIENKQIHDDLLICSSQIKATSGNIYAPVTNFPSLFPWNT